MNRAEVPTARLARARINVWAVVGILAPILYVVAVVLGGMLTPGYSHAAGPISALTMSGAPAVGALVAVFALYNAFLAAFALALRDMLHEKGVRLSLLAPVFLAVTAIAGAAMLVYPMDPIGLASTEAGRLHGFFAGIAAVGTVVAVLFTATSLIRVTAWRALALYSFAALAVVVITGLTADIMAAEASPWMGLAERIAIGAFLQWVFVLALALVRR